MAEFVSIISGIAGTVGGFCAVCQLCMQWRCQHRRRIVRVVRKERLQ